MSKKYGGNKNQYFYYFLFLFFIFYFLFFVFVFSTAGSEEALKIIEQEGCSKTFNHKSENYVQEIIKAGGSDLIIEMMPSSNLQNDISILKYGGTISKKKI